MSTGAVDAEFVELFGRPPSEEERTRLLGLGASLRRRETGARDAQDTDVLSPLMRNRDARRQKLRASRVAFAVLIATIIFLVWNIYARGGSVDFVSVVVGAIIAGAIVVLVQLTLDRFLEEDEREVSQIVRLARQGAPEWLDEYSRWLRSAPCSAAWRRWLALPAGSCLSPP